MNLFNKKLGLNATISINFLSSFVLQGIAFVTIPIFSRLLGAEQFGLYSLFTSWVSIFAIMIAFGIGNSIGPGKFKFKDDYLNFKNNIILFNIIVPFIFSCIMCFLYSFLSTFLVYDFYIYFFIILTAFSQNFISVIINIFIFDKKAIANFVITVLLSLSTTILSLVLINNFCFTNIYIGRVIGHLLPYIVMTVFIIIVFFFRFNVVFKINYLFFGFSIGIPLVFHNISNFLLNQSDRIMMQKMCIDLSNIGIYSLFWSFCSVIQVILGAFNTAFSPFYAEYIDCNNKKSMICKSKNYIEIFTAICIGFLLLSREVAFIMADESFYYGINLIPLFVLSIYFIFLYQFAVNYELYCCKTKIIACGTLGAAILNILLNFYFIKKNGMYGAAFSTLISYFILFVFHYIIAINIKLSRFYFDFKFLIINFLLLLIFVLCFYILKDCYIIRWSIGILIGIFEFIRLLKRKSIF